MLLKELGYVVEAVCIFGRTTGDVHAMVNCYAPTSRLMTHPPQGHLAGLRCNLRLLVFGIGEEW